MFYLSFSAFFRVKTSVIRRAFLASSSASFTFRDRVLVVSGGTGVQALYVSGRIGHFYLIGVAYGANGRGRALGTRSRALSYTVRGIVLFYISGITFITTGRIRTFIAIITTRLTYSNISRFVTVVSEGAFADTLEFVEVVSVVTGVAFSSRKAGGAYSRTRKTGIVGLVGTVGARRDTTSLV